MEARVDTMEARVDTMEARVDTMEARASPWLESQDFDPILSPQALIRVAISSQVYIFPHTFAVH